LSASQVEPIWVFGWGFYSIFDIWDSVLFELKKLIRSQASLGENVETYLEGRKSGRNKSAGKKAVSSE